MFFNKKPELLAPAGDFEKLKVALNYGADAVYCGLNNFSLRSNSRNFTIDQLKEAIIYTQKNKKKIYITLNSYLNPEDIKDFIEILEILNDIKPDGIIISDLGALYLAKKYSPDINIHISTQANTQNQYAIKIYEDLGVKRIILGRELNLDQIKIIRESTELELEVFIHGSMCIAYSGRCILSSYMTKKNLGARKNETSEKNRSANRGDCVHPCRWEYVLKEKSREDQEFPIEEDKNGTYILSSKDLCMIFNISDLVNCGIDSFKIEGRMKSILYVSSIIRAYRYAIDSFFNNVIIDKDFINNELNIVSHREFSTGFFYDNPKLNSQLTENIIYRREVRLGAMVIDKNSQRSILKIYNTISINDQLEIIGKNIKTIKIKSFQLFDKDNIIKDKINHTDYAEAIFYDENNLIINTEIFDIIRINTKF